MSFPIHHDVTDVARVTERRMRFEAPARRVEDVAALLKGGGKVTLHGKRHSQGGHVLLRDAVSLDIESLQAARVDAVAGRARVEAGATWDHLHAALAAEPNKRWAPSTHQSSPYFSVGGSLAVNCHGRDPRQRPIAGTVEALDVMLADGSVVRTDANTEQRLFKTVLGGFGAGGIIVSASLRLKEERQLRHEVTPMSLSRYCALLCDRVASGNWPPMHHGFLKFDQTDFFGEVLSSDSVDIGPPRPDDLVHEGFLSDDGLGTLYKVFREEEDKSKWWWVFREILTREQKQERTLNAMRANVRFSALMGVSTTDLLHEFFIPPLALEKFLTELREILELANVNLLSSTTRVVQPDDTPFLNYARGTKPLVSVVLNINVPKVDVPGAMTDWVSEAIGRLPPDGSFYLPYMRCATLAQFQHFYPNHAAFSAARREFDPGLVFDNDFLVGYGL